MLTDPALQILLQISKASYLLKLQWKAKPQVLSPAKNRSWFFTLTSPFPEAPLQSSSSSQSPLSDSSSSVVLSGVFCRGTDIPFSSWKAQFQSHTQQNFATFPLPNSFPVPWANRFLNTRNYAYEAKPLLPQRLKLRVRVAETKGKGN